MQTTQTIESCIQEISQKFTVIDIINCDLYKESWIDLWVDLKKIHQLSYQDTQRIVFTSTYDYYENNNHGIILQSLQNIINELDIPNFFICFVTTNKKIDLEYDFILKNYSYDKNPFRLFSCEGDFNRKQSLTVKPFIKIQNFNKNKIQELMSLDEKQKTLLFKSENFCIAPWVSTMINPNSDVRPCCMYTESVGNLKSETLEKIWNNKKYQEIRKKMINDQSVSGCQRCLKIEKLGKDSSRTSFNREFLNHADKIKNTQPNGSLNSFELVYFDARFNNLCNLSCRMCDETLSTTWHRHATNMGIIDKKIPRFLSASNNKSSLIDQLIEHVDTLEQIYFAGGEPLIIDEFYQLLSFLDQKHRHDVQLVYNTNLTKIRLKDKNIFDYWKNFKNISIGASLDAEYARGEYLRSGTNWNDVISNRKKMLENRPDIDFSINATVSIINCLHVVDFHKSWVNQGFIDPEDFNINILFSPTYLKVSNAPDALKEKIKKKYHDHLTWLRPLDTLGRATAGFEGILAEIDNNDNFDKSNFWKNVNTFDNYYKTKLLETFPELIDLK